MIKSDYKAFNMSVAGLIKGIFVCHTFYAVLLYRIGNWFYRHKIKFIPDIFKAIQLKVFACEISPYAKIGESLKIYHSVGIVVGHAVEIGNNCEIFQNVTIGENRKERNGQKMAKIGDNVSIFAGACIIGPVNIGNNVKIGANSVVTHDIEDNVVVAGTPARVIKRL